MKTRNEQYLGQRKLIHEIIDLCIEINDKTELAAFFYYSGHVGMFSVRIAKSKDDYNNHIVSLEVDMHVNRKKRALEIIKKKLLNILRHHERTQ